MNCAASKCWTRSLAVVLLLGLAFLILSFHLNADAPKEASDSSGLYFDPPSKCHNARNITLFGQWVTDEWTPFLHSPVYTLAQAVNFRLFGVGFFQMRMLSVLASTLALAFVFLIVRRQSGYAAGILALLISMICYPLIINGRSGLLEPFEICFILLSAWSLAKGYDNDARSGPWFFLAGLAASLAFLSKPFAGLFILSLFLSIGIYPPRRKIALIWLIVAVAVPLGLYFGPFMHANAVFFQRESAHWTERGLATRNWFDLWIHQPLFVAFPYTRWPIVLAVLASGWALFSAKKSEDRSRSIAIVALAWTFILISQCLAFLDYRPDRYYVIVLAPVFVLAVAGMAAFYRWLMTPSLPEMTFGRYLAAGLALAFAITFGVLSLLSALIHVHVPHEIRLVIACAMVVALLVLWRISVKRLAAGLSRCASGARRNVFAALITLSLIAFVWPNADAYWQWIHHPFQTMVGFSRMLGDQYRNAVLAGPSPLFSVMENRHRALKVTSYHINWPAMESGEVTHLVIPTVGDGADVMKEHFPAVMKRAVLLDDLLICDLRVSFYAIGLRPIRIVTAQHADQMIVLAVNQDPHTPQTCCLIGLDASGVTSCHTIHLLPEQATSIPLAQKSAGRLYAIPDSAWTDTEDGCFSRGTYLLDDPLARHLFVRTFRRPENKPAEPIAREIVMPVTTNGTILIGAKLRGRLDPDDRVELQWRQNGMVTQRRAIAAEELSPSQYRYFAITAVRNPAENTEAVLSFNGRGELYVDGLLALDADKIADVAFWSKTIDEHP